MRSKEEIEDAIEKLPQSEVEELAKWLEALRMRRAAVPPIERWLDQARGAANPGVTTEKVLAITRGDE